MRPSPQARLQRALLSAVPATRVTLGGLIRQSAKHRVTL
jgi:hypothetical protein